MAGSGHAYVDMWWAASVAHRDWAFKLVVPLLVWLETGAIRIAVATIRPGEPDFDQSVGQGLAGGTRAYDPL
jgi:hypothetical protein